MHKPTHGTALYSGSFAVSTFAWAATIALLMSTEFLAQPFIWRGWTFSGVFAGWSRVALDRLLVACSISLCVVITRNLSMRYGRAQTPILVAAVVGGAALGEVLRAYVGPFASQRDIRAVLGHIVHWTLIGLAVVSILACWRIHSSYAETAAEAAVANSRARRLLIASELDGLQRQIEPHFLFNTLATIRRFGLTAPADGFALLERLFDYISKTIRTSQIQESDLGAELDLVRAYLDVCAARMGRRLTVVADIDPALRRSSFPPLMLGTLVENAIKHGLAPLSAGGTITLSAERKGGMLEVCVQDDGIGLIDEGGTGIGLANLSARLRLLYGEAASLRLDSIAPHGVLAKLRIPYVLAS